SRKAPPSFDQVHNPRRSLIAPNCRIRIRASPRGNWSAQPRLLRDVVRGERTNMPVPSRARSRQHRRVRQFRPPGIEQLEARTVTTVATWPGLINPRPEAEPNDTLDLSLKYPLGDLSTSGRADVVGTIGNSPAGAADVDWFSFTLSRAAEV